LGASTFAAGPVIVTARPVIAASFVRSRFVLGPLGAEAETLELSEVEFIKILGGIFVRCGIVHDVRFAKKGVITLGVLWQELCL
jgi:hypothetical protein